MSVHVVATASTRTKAPMTQIIQEPRKGRETFRPRARLVSVLGDQLIRDATVGLLELVKNGYDADATQVTVQLLNLSNPAETTITVEDNGSGMDLDTILYKWLEPATGHKEEAKKQDLRSQRGRLPLGEKGVGRFAAHKLGRHLTLVSRARDEQKNLGKHEVVVTIDWDVFDDPHAYLSDVGVDYEERTPLHFLNSSGTYMEMRSARAPWTQGDVSRVSRALRRLMSPFRTPESFSVNLICPEYSRFEDLDPSDVLSTAHAHMIVLVDEFGVAEFEYIFKIDPYPERQLGVATQETIDLRQIIGEWDPVDRKPVCGSFAIVLYIWDRDASIFNKASSSISRGELNQYNGISVFRDGIRVMPYGEPDNDWLEIDKDRYLATSDAFSRRNVIGAVEIDQKSNRDLRDKSNREGFIENQAYNDLYYLTRAVIKVAQKEFAHDRRIMREKQKAERKKMIPAVSQLEDSVKKVSDAIESTRSMADQFVRDSKISPDIADQMLARLSITRQTLQEAVDETRQAAADTLTTFDEEREMLLALAGIGLAAERFTHEFARLTHEASDLLKEIQNSSSIQQSARIKQQVEALAVTLDALRDLVLLLGPMFYIRRKTSIKPLNVRTIVGHALLLNEGQIRDNQIQVEIEEPDGGLTVTMRAGALTQVFNNLIDNACFWLGRKSEETNRHLRITILAVERAVIIADDGPGIHPRDRSRIFNTFFSTKVDGRGLGLFIARETLAEAQATIELIDHGDAPGTFRVGAAFKIQFPHLDD